MYALQLESKDFIKLKELALGYHLLIVAWKWVVLIEKNGFKSCNLIKGNKSQLLILSAEWKEDKNIYQELKWKEFRKVK